MGTVVNYDQKELNLNKSDKFKGHKIVKNMKRKKRADVLFQRIGVKVYAIMVLAGETYWTEVPV